ncbi:helix-turn-helix transcriptional regulator [Sphingomonas sp.]|uniref:helix-turn-helix transcriptional regulator n=1 Tax=Sphingomonas sp. TaxID=28214 RepID=UPI003AFFE0D2
MVVSHPDELDLVTAIHAGAIEEPLWATFLARVRRRVRADHAGLVFRRSDALVADAFELHDGDPGMAGLDRRIFDHGTRAVRQGELRPERVYALDEALDVHKPGDRHFRAEILEPAGFRFARVVRIVESGGFGCWFVVARAARDFAAADGALIAGLAPHLTIALRSYATIERERFRSGIAEDAIRRLDFGWLTLAADGRVVDLDASAERMLARSPALRRAHGRLVAASADADRALVETLRRFAGDPHARPRAIHLSDEPWFDLLLRPADGRVASRGTTPVAIAYLHGDAGPSAHRVEQLGDLFALSGGEARLALALSRGRSIAEAAADLGLTIETARHYSKRAYSKTGTRGQADLVRVILASVVALA